MRSAWAIKAVASFLGTGLLLTGVIAVTQASAAAASGFKVALLTSGPANDGGWDQQAVQGLAEIHKVLGVKTAYTDNVAASQQAQLMRTYATNGFNLIICNGYEYAQAVQQVAPSFPKVHFVIINGSIAKGNITSTTFRFGELGWFVGMVAGYMTRDGKVGFLIPQMAPSNTADLHTFEQAVKAVNPAARVTVSVVGSWNNVVKATQEAQAQIARGADVLCVMGNAFTLPVIKLAQKHHVYVIGGWSGDNYSMAPNDVLTSAVQDPGRIDLLMTELAMKGQIKPKVYVFGMNTGAQSLGRFGTMVPQRLRRLMRAAVTAYVKLGSMVIQ